MVKSYSRNLLIVAFAPVALLLVAANVDSQESNSFGNENRVANHESVVVAAPDQNNASNLWAEANIETRGNVDPLQKTLPGPSTPQTKAGSLLDSIDAKTRRSIAKMVGGLAIVVAIFVVFVTIFGKRKNQGASASGSALEILSRSMLNKNQQMQLVRLGNRLLLIASSEHRVDTLAEIVDPQEIAEIEQMLKQGDNSFFERTRQRLSNGTGSPMSRRQPVYEA